MNSILQPTILEQGRSADIWEELDDGTMYMGYAQNGTIGTDEAKFLIVKVETVSATVSKKIYAEGSKDFDKSWDNRAGYTYKFAR